MMTIARCCTYQNVCVCR